jgi:uncharacterized membrane protein
MDKHFHRLFRVGVILKGIDAVLEVIGGVILLIVPSDAISRLIVTVTQYQLIQNPNNLFAKLAEKGVEVANESQLWAGLFLLSHGLVKVLIVVGMVLKKLWAYRIGLVVFAGLVIYQICDVLKTHSLGLLALTVLDFIFILLGWREYRQLKRGRGGG